MREVLKFLTDNPVFYIATIEGDKPRVRPFGFVMESEGKLYFGTNDTKPVYRQLKENPNFEISTANSKGEWMRLAGRAVFDSRPELKAKAFEAAPYLADLYGSSENPIFTLFFITEGEATFCSMASEPRTIKL